MSEYSDYKKRRQELVETKKGENVQSGVGEIILPQTPKEKWENYWYHYKFHTYAVIFAVVVLTVMIINICTKVKPDFTLILASGESFEGSTQMFDDVITPYVPDYNGDGKVTVETHTIFLNSDSKEAESEVVMANQAKLMAMVQDPNVCVYIVDEANYNDIILMGGSFKDITDIVPKDAVVADKTKYVLKNSSFAKAIDMNHLLDGMYLCIIDDNNPNGMRLEGKYKENYDYCMEIFKSFVNS